MIFDKTNMFSEAQAITATAASDNVIDLGLGDIGKSGAEAPWLYVKCDAAFTLLDTLNIKLQTSVDSAFTSPIDTILSVTPARAALTLNSEQLLAKLPIGCKRYVRLYYTVAGTNPDAGKITAGLTPDVQASH